MLTDRLHQYVEKNLGNKNNVPENTNKLNSLSQCQHNHS